MRIPQDIIGDIAIVKFSKFTPKILKRIYGYWLIKKQKYIKVVLEKTEGFSGVLRIQKTDYIAGEKRKQTVHKENGCIFYLDVDKTYFSPRLSEERKKISKEIREMIVKNNIKNPKILVMFAGVAPFPIVLGKLLKADKIEAEIISSELNVDAGEFAEKNVIANKLEKNIKVFSGDSRKLCSNFLIQKKKFDFVVMPRPNLSESFLGAAFNISKKGTIIFYYGFGDEQNVKEEIFQEARKLKRKISLLQIRKAGEIGVKKFRLMARLKVLN